MEYESSPLSSSPFNPSRLRPSPSTSSAGPTSSSPSNPHAQTSQHRSYKSHHSSRKTSSAGRGENLHDRFLDRCLSRLKTDRKQALNLARGTTYTNALYAKAEGGPDAVWTPEEELMMRRMIRRDLEKFKRDYSDDWVDAVGQDGLDDAVEHEEAESMLDDRLDQADIGSWQQDDTTCQPNDNSKQDAMQDMDMDDQTPTNTPLPSFTQLISSSPCINCKAPSSAITQSDSTLGCVVCQWAVSVQILQAAQPIFEAHGLPPNHRPVFYHDSMMGTGCLCSGCEEMLALS